MKSALPGRTELLIFIAMALVAGLIVALSGQRDTMLFFTTLPVFFVAALMGFRRSLKVQPIEVRTGSEDAEKQVVAEERG